MAFELPATRHGRTGYNETQRINGNTNEDHLSEVGRQQIPILIQKVGNLLVPVTVIYSSPLDRALEETAKPIASHFGLPIKIDERLMEVNHGSLTGESWDATVPLFGKRSPQLLASGTYDFTREGGENYQIVESRVGAAAGDIRRDAEENGENPLVIAHGGVLYAFQKLTGQEGRPLPNAEIFMFTFP